MGSSHDEDSSELTSERYPEKYKSGDFFREKEKELELYGEIVDPNGMGVDGVDVTYSMIDASYYMRNNLDERPYIHVTRSDEDGRFAIHREKAIGIFLMKLEKSGMEWLDYRGRHHVLAKDIGRIPRITQSNPLVFMMVPEGRYVPRYKSQRVVFTWNQGPTRSALAGVDLDLMIDLKRSRNAHDEESFDWSMEVSLDQGEIQELHTEGPMLAPLDGYQPRFCYKQYGGDPNWSGSIGGELILVYRTAKGEYGTLDFLLDMTTREGEPDSVIVTGHHNPTGERYLR